MEDLIKRARNGEISRACLGEIALQHLDEEEIVDKFLENDPERSREEIYETRLLWRLQKILDDYKKEKANRTESINSIFQAFRFMPTKQREHWFCYHKNKN